MMQGRRLFLNVLCIAPALAACAQTPSGGVVLDVTLQAAQSETNAIMAALETIAANIVPTLAANAQNAVNTAIAGLDVAVKAFLGVTPGGTVIDYAKQAISAIASVMAVLPIASNVMMYLTAGLALLGAFVNGVPSVTVPAYVTNAGPQKLPATLKLGRALPPPPIPVPVA